MLYTRVHNQTVAEDYYAAMAEIERCLDPTAGRCDVDEAVSASERASPLKPLGQLAELQLDLKARLDLIAQIQHVLYSGPP
jgi:hypothetical protein